MKDDYYFKHDAHARHDPKIKALINQYGIEGYGMWWIVLEEMRSSTGYKLENEDYIWESLAEQMKCDVARVKKFIKDCVEKFKLFVQDGDFIFSPSFLYRMTKLDEIRRKRADAAHKSWENR